MSLPSTLSSGRTMPLYAWVFSPFAVPAWLAINGSMAKTRATHTPNRLVQVLMTSPFITRPLTGLRSPSDVFPQAADLLLLVLAWPRRLDPLRRLLCQAIFDAQIVMALLGPQVELDRHVAKREMIPQRVEQVAMVRLVEQVGPVREDHNRRRIDRHLRDVVDLRHPVLSHRRRPGLDRLLDAAIEVCGRHAHRRLLVQVLSEVDDLLDVLAIFCGQERDRHVLQAREDTPQIVAVLARQGFSLGEVPLVDHEHRRFVVVQNVAGELLVHHARLLARVEQVQHHVGPPDRSLGPRQAVEVDVALDAPSISNAGSVDGEDCLAVALEVDIDAVARRTFHLADDRAFLFGGGVDYRALA